MNIETETHNTELFRNILFRKAISLVSLPLILGGCSFVELNKGAESIIFAPPGDGCEVIHTFEAEVKTSTLFIERQPKAIAAELQILAQNEAYKHYANAIWPVSEVEEGKQRFEILNCKPVSRCCK